MRIIRSLCDSIDIHHWNMKWFVWGAESVLDCSTIAHAAIAASKTHSHELSASSSTMTDKTRKLMMTLWLYHHDGVGDGTSVMVCIVLVWLPMRLNVMMRSWWWKSKFGRAFRAVTCVTYTYKMSSYMFVSSMSRISAGQYINAIRILSAKTTICLIHYKSRILHWLL